MKRKFLGRRGPAPLWSGLGYLTYVLDAIMQMELPRSWRPYIGKWVLGSAFMAIVVIALVYAVVEIFSGLFDVIVPLHIPAR